MLNRDHHEEYYAGTPMGPQGQLLRRHGDQMQRFANDYFRAHGRADDCMNLGGIKVSSLEIEEVVGDVEGVSETAAVAVSSPEGGPSMLVVYIVPAGEMRVDLQTTCVSRCSRRLPPGSTRCSRFTTSLLPMRYPVRRRTK